MMPKALLKKVLKTLFGVMLCAVLAFAILIGFYIWMIYGIHPSDEGSGGLSCEYDKNLNVTKAEMMLIQNGKRVFYQADPERCKKNLDGLP